MKGGIGTIQTWKMTRTGPFDKSIYGEEKGALLAINFGHTWSDPRGIAFYLVELDLGNEETRETSRPFSERTVSPISASFRMCRKWNRCPFYETMQTSSRCFARHCRFSSSNIDHSRPTLIRFVWRKWVRVNFIFTLVLWNLPN